MERYSTILGAYAAGKLPSQEQINRIIEWLLQSNLIQIEATIPTEGQLSLHGKEIARDLRSILDAYKTLGKSKNDDDILQDALYNLAQGAQSADIQVNVDTNINVDEGRTDAQQLSSALRTIVNILITNSIGPGSSIFQDFASFIRLGLADTAEAVEHEAAKAKESLRQTDAEVKEGERNAFGLRNQQDLDSQQKFERTMDSVKEIGSKAIGTGQQASAKASEYSQRSQERLFDALNKIIRRSQGDEEYQSAVQTLFGLMRKWLSKKPSTTSSRPIKLDTFVEDPTGRLPHALRQLRTFIERCAGGKSLSDTVDAVNHTSTTIRSDEELYQFVDAYLVYAQKNLQSVDYHNSDEGARDRENLEARARELGLTAKEEGEEKRREYKECLRRLNSELEEYQLAISRDPDFARLKEAHVALGETVVNAGKDAIGASGNLSLSAATSWIWQDILNVYLPRIVDMFKGIPLPRTEYVDPQVEFVFENIDIASLNLAPGHAHIRQVADIDLTQNQTGSNATTSVSGTTQIQLQTVQMKLDAISFYYHDKETTLGPDTYTGLLDIALPPRGIDIDMSISMLPTSSHNERQRAKRFFKIDKINVDLSSDTTLSLRQTNHPILITAFKPIFKSRLLAALQASLERQIRATFDFIDYTAYDVHMRSEVFQDGGVPTSVAYLGAIWSEFGRLQKLPGGPFSRWKVGGYGVVKDDEKTDTAFAVGIEPQILSGDKHGPQAKFTEKKSGEEGSSAIGGEANSVVARGEEQLKAGLEKTRTFAQRVKEKRDQEKQKEGWRSDAFDVFEKQGGTTGEILNYIESKMVWIAGAGTLP